jgi:RNA polymerase sigma-70 factor (ECF subfamily)
MTDPPRTDDFLAALPAGLRASAEALPDLPATLGRLVAAARSAWPGLVADDAAFVAHLASRLPVGEPLGESLESARIDDLYLAWACLRKNTRAMEQVRTLCFSDLDVAWRRYAHLGKDLDDIKQTLSERLFVGTHERGPKIGEYAARGTLRGWLRAIVANLLANVAARETREVPVDDDVLSALGGEADAVELAHVKSVYGDALREALASAIEGLGSREKNVLRYRFADNLSIEQIAAIYGVHRATASQWLAVARDALATATRSELVARLRLTDSELASVLRVAMSQIELTLSRHLRVRPA